MTTDTHVRWDDLVSAALLGTDRRDPPEPVAGPLAAFVLEAPARDAAGALAQHVAAVTVLARAAARPLAAPPLLVPAESDPRPLCPPAAVSLLHRVLVDWPMLEPEWLAAATRGGWRLSPEMVPVLLRRHRSHEHLRDAVVALAGPIAPWLVDHVDGLAPTTRRAPSAGITLSPELAAVAEADVAAIVAVITDGMRRGRYTIASRAVVVHLVAHLPVDRLPALAAALDALDRDTPGRGLAHHLVDLAETRLAIVAALASSDLDSDLSSTISSERGDR